MTLAYDTSPDPRIVQPSDRRTNMTYDPGPRATTATANPPPPEPDGDEPIVVVKPS